MGTKYFSVGLNNTTRGDGCEFRGSGWTLGNKFFIRAVVHNQNRLSRKAEVLKDLSRQSHKHSQTHIHVYEHVNPRLPVTLLHLTQDCSHSCTSKTSTAVWLKPLPL